MEKKIRKDFAWLAILLSRTVWVLTQRNKQAPYNSINGSVFGTVYNITYQYGGNLKAEINTELERFSGPLSFFNGMSIITRVSRNEETVTGSFFQTCFNRSMEVSAETQEAFDIIVAPSANAWGLGFKKGIFPDPTMIGGLLGTMDHQEMGLEDGEVIKEDPRVTLSRSAVTKGYSVDMVTRYLDGKSIKSYVVDIDGELAVRGLNPKDEAWRISVNKPVDDSLSLSQETQIMLKLADVGITTSENYHNFHYKDGKEYACTIDPHIECPIQHNILSATVVAEDCMTADALATTLMVVGLDETEAFTRPHPNIGTYFIHSDEKGELKSYFTKDIKQHLDK